MRNLTSSTHRRTRALVLIALFAVFMAICSWIALPVGAVSITLQTFAVYLALDFLGGKKGTAAICLYLGLGLVGVPVFSHFNAGAGALLGPTGGYLIGWIAAGLVVWLFEAIGGGRLWARITSALIGLTVIYATGTAWFMVVYAKTTAPVGLGTALLWCVAPFVLPDLVKIGGALWLGRRLRRIGMGFEKTFEKK